MYIALCANKEEEYGITRQTDRQADVQYVYYCRHSHPRNEHYLYQQHKKSIYISVQVTTKITLTSRPLIIYFDAELAANVAGG